MIESIRLATEADLPRILAIANWAAAETTANFATEPESLDDWRASWRATHDAYPWLVSGQHHDVIGFAKAAPHRNRGAYAWTAEVSVYVDPAHHGRGVGAALYHALFPLLREQGFVTVLAGITAGHAASERLHEKFGFVRAGTFERVGWKQGAWLDVAYWQLALARPEGAPSARRSVASTWRRR